MPISPNANSQSNDKILTDRRGDWNEFLFQQRAYDHNTRVTTPRYIYDEGVAAVPDELSIPRLGSDCG